MVKIFQSHNFGFRRFRGDIIDVSKILPGKYDVTAVPKLWLATSSEHERTQISHISSEIQAVQEVARICPRPCDLDL